MDNLITKSVEFLSKELSLLKDVNPYLVNSIITDIINCNINNYPKVYDIFMKQSLFCEESIAGDEDRVSLNSISLTNMIFRFKVLLSEFGKTTEYFNNLIDDALAVIIRDDNTSSNGYLEVLDETYKNRDKSLLSNLLFLGSVYRLDIPFLMIKYLTGNEHERNKN